MKKGLILVPYVHADSPTKRLVNSVLKDGYHLCGKFEFFYLFIIFLETNIHTRERERGYNTKFENIDLP